MAKQSIYQREIENLEQSKNFLKKSDYSKLELQLEYKKLVENYEELIDQVKIITKISDRLQKKLNKTNEALENSNNQLAELNYQLNETIDQLTEAKIGRRAATIVMIVAIALFIISEAFIEPQIDKMFPNNFLAGLGLKLIVAILIKPGEDFANKYMLRKARKKQLEEAKAQGL
jgi:predicted nuclease with TOPRIM domain